MTREDVIQLDAALNARILEGRTLDAFDAFYHDDVTMHDGASVPVVGKAANRTRERQFAAAVSEFRAQLFGSTMTGDRSYSEWVFDVTFRDGRRWHLEQVAVRDWQQRKVVRERFYHNAHPPAPPHADA